MASAAARNLPAETEEICEQILAVAQKVNAELRKVLGRKLTEKNDYHPAFSTALIKAGLKAQNFYPIETPYGSRSRKPDLLINGCVLVEAKKENWSNQGLKWQNFAQGYHYVRASALPVCLVVNFGGMDIQVMWVTPDAEITLAERS